MPVIETKGAASSGGFGQFARQVAANYIEDVFSTWLYDGQFTSLTINNGIDLSTKGGLTWIKRRNLAINHVLHDTARGANNALFCNTTNPQSGAGGLSAFTSTGFTLGGGIPEVNNGYGTYASWTFRKQAKFFDVVTYTGNGTVPRSISHSLASVPGFIVIKCTTNSGNWICRHRSVGDTPNDMTNYTPNSRLFLNTTDGAVGSSNIKADASTFTVNHVGDLNTSGQTYVAYIFAHNAGGFGAAGTDNVISCGSYTGSAYGFPVINLGFEPQWVLIKRVDSASFNDWMIFDNMRGFGLDAISGFNLKANLSDAEQNLYTITPTATGFSPTTNGAQTNGDGALYVYIAIRRGPMRTPTSGTSVFAAEAWTGANTDNVQRFNNTFSSDAVLSRNRTNNIGANSGTNPPTFMTAKLAGAGVGVSTMFTNAEIDFQGTFVFQNNSVIFPNANPPFNLNGDTFVGYSFRRAPGFFDVVCYTGDGTSNRNVTHSLGVTPSFYIVKRRSSTGALWTWQAAFNGGVGYGELNSSGQFGTSTTIWGTGAPTSTTFPVSYSEVNSSGGTFVAYLFADCPGISKAGIYVGTATAQTVNCGFTSGARFVLIKRTTGAGYDWYVWDTARGINAGNDPYLLLSNTNPEVTNTDYISVQSSGFGITATAPAALNASGVNYFFLAIA